MKRQKLETTPEISKRMTNVKLKGGKTETILAKSLWPNSIRYRKNYKILPESPDIAITKYKIAVFVDGEYWHGENWENRKIRLKKNRDYWIKKLKKTWLEIKETMLFLIDLDWIPIHFWEREILNDVDKCSSVILKIIKKDNESNKN